MFTIGHERASKAARLAIQLATLNHDIQIVSATPTPNQQPVSIPFTVRPHVDDVIDLSRYDKDKPNFKKHQETCARNRRKRKAKKKPKY